MSTFEDCTPEELAAFTKIVEGDAIENHDPEIVQRLVERNLLSHFNETDLTVPALVWNEWKHYKEDEIEHDEPK